MEAFEVIVKDHSPKIYNFLRRLGLEHEDADEILQDVFILLWQDLKRGQGLDAVDLSLYQHAVKKALNFFNKDGNTPLENSNVRDNLIFVLKHHEGFEFGEISEMTSIDVGDLRDSFKSELKLKAAKIKGSPY